MINKFQINQTKRLFFSSADQLSINFKKLTSSFFALKMITITKKSPKTSPIPSKITNELDKIKTKHLILQKNENKNKNKNKNKSQQLNVVISISL